MLVEDFAYPSLLKYFEEISAIPRGSYHEEAIADYLSEFAKMRGLSFYRDKVGNVLINLPASAGYESCAPILLQGHTDMVCEKNEGVAHDFLKDPLRLYTKDGWICAEGTTLGADNGVAVAVMLALLDGASEKHPPLQCLFTVSEEVGMDGVKVFDYSKITARKMMNMDSADESSITVGCAGGVRSNMKIKIERRENSTPLLKLRITGLAGGHSGEDIHRGRTNANKLLGRILLDLSQRYDDLCLLSVRGGEKENAIPRESEAVFAVSDREGAKRFLDDCFKEISPELCGDDRNFAISTEELSSTDQRVMSRASTERIIFLLATIPNGVFAMNQEFEGIVEYSRNLGVLRTEEDSVTAIINSRSARDSQINASIAQLNAYASMLGGEVSHYNRYPGWVYAKSSEIREEYTAAYRELFGTEPKQEVIHAGLECGIIKEALPDIDMISCGPIVVNLHSPDEALHISSFERFFTVILKVLSNAR